MFHCLASRANNVQMSEDLVSWKGVYRVRVFISGCGCLTQYSVLYGWEGTFVRCHGWLFLLSLIVIIFD